MKTYKEKTSYKIIYRIENRIIRHGFQNIYNFNIGYNYHHQYKGFNLQFFKH
jgi:hypothetical protein